MTKRMGGIQVLRIWVISTTFEELLGPAFKFLCRTSPSNFVEFPLLGITESQTGTGHSKLYQEQQEQNDHILESESRKETRFLFTSPCISITAHPCVHVSTCPCLSTSSSPVIFIQSRNWDSNTDLQLLAITFNLSQFTLLGFAAYWWASFKYLSTLLGFAT